MSNLTPLHLQNQIASNTTDLSVNVHPFEMFVEFLNES